MIFTIKSGDALRETLLHHPGFSMTYSDRGTRSVVARMDKHWPDILLVLL